MTRKRSVLITVIVVSLLIVGCGDDDSGAPTTDSQAVATTSSSTPTTPVSTTTTTTAAPTTTTVAEDDESLYALPMVWISGGPDDAGRVIKVDTATGEVVATIETDGLAGQIAFGAGGLWAVSCDEGVIRRIDPGHGTLEATVDLGGCARPIATGAGKVWVAVLDTESVVAIDPSTNEVAAEFPAGGFPLGLDLFEDPDDPEASTIWVGTQDKMLFVYALDGTELAAIEVGTPVFDVLVAFDLVWVLDHQGKLLWFDPVTYEALGSHDFGMLSYQVDAAAGKIVVAFPGEGEVYWGNPASGQPFETPGIYADAYGATGYAGAIYLADLHGNLWEVPQTDSPSKRIAEFVGGTGGIYLIALARDPHEGGTKLEVCPLIEGKVPHDTIDRALAYPYTIRGYGLTDPNLAPNEITNPHQTTLTLKDLDRPYHPLYNPLVYSAGCT